MDLIVVGNGFDLANELPTSYEDFRLFLKCRNDLSVLSLEKLFPKKINGKMLLWSDFEEALARPNKRQLNELHELMNTLEENHTWLVDILRDTFVKWIEDICFYGPTQLDKTHPFYSYLKKDNLYLSFNYTETLERFYDIQNVLHIHGCPIHNGEETHDCVVFGHRPIKTKNTYVLSTEKPVGELITRYNNWFKALSKKVDGDIVVIGLSCSEVDQLYLKRISISLPNNNWVFFYHIENDLCNCERCAENLGLNKDKCTFRKC